MQCRPLDWQNRLRIHDPWLISQTNAIVGRLPLQMAFFTFLCLLRLFAANSFWISSELYGHKKAQKAQTGKGVRPEWH